MLLKYNKIKYNLLIKNLLLTNKLVRNRIKILNFSLNNTHLLQNKNYIIFPLGGISADIVDSLRINLKKYDFFVIQQKKAFLKLNISDNILNSIFLGQFLIIELKLNSQSLLYSLNIFSEILSNNLLSDFELFFLFFNIIESNKLTIKSNKQIKELLHFNPITDITIFFKITNILNNLNYLILYKLIILIKILKLHKNNFL